MSKTIFERGLEVDISKHVEKKGRFSYLSWTFAVCELRKLDPNATWEVKHFNNQPFMQSDCGYFVEVAVILSDGPSFAQIHPVLDNSNKSLMSPTSFQINTSIQRCLVKAIALASGIGLSLYAGEDLPVEEKKENPREKTFTESIEAAKKVIGDEFVFDCLTSYKYNNPEEVKEEDKESILADLRKQAGKVRESQSQRND